VGWVGVVGQAGGKQQSALFFRGASGKIDRVAAKCGNFTWRSDDVAKALRRDEKSHRANDFAAEDGNDSGVAMILKTAVGCV
jgi:hypothetical protein